MWSWSRSGSTCMHASWLLCARCWVLMSVSACVLLVAAQVPRALRALCVMTLKLGRLDHLPPGKTCQTGRLPLCDPREPTNRPPGPLLALAAPCPVLSCPCPCPLRSALRLWHPPGWLPHPPHGSCSRPSPPPGLLLVLARPLAHSLTHAPSRPQAVCPEAPPPARWPARLSGRPAAGSLAYAMPMATLPPSGQPTASRPIAQCHAAMPAVSDQSIGAIGPLGIGRRRGGMGGREGAHGTHTHACTAPPSPLSLPRGLPPTLPPAYLPIPSQPVSQPGQPTYLLACLPGLPDLAPHPPSTVHLPRHHTPYAPPITTITLSPFTFHSSHPSILCIHPLTHLPSNPPSPPPTL